MKDVHDWKRRIKLNTKKYLKRCIASGLPEDEGIKSRSLTPIKNYSIITNLNRFNAIFKNLCCDTLKVREETMKEVGYRSTSKQEYADSMVFKSRQNSSVDADGSSKLITLNFSKQTPDYMNVFNSSIDVRSK